MQSFPPSSSPEAPLTGSAPSSPHSPNSFASGAAAGEIIHQIRNIGVDNCLISGALSRVLVAPLDVLKIRLQVMPSAIASHRGN
jgi:hypothetical protein